MIEIGCSNNNNNNNNNNIDNNFVHYNFPVYRRNQIDENMSIIKYVMDMFNSYELINKIEI